MTKTAIPISYDPSLDYTITMYDSLPYERNSVLCGPDQISVYSGNVIKQFSYRLEEETLEIPNQDERTLPYIKKQRQLVEAAMTVATETVILDDNTEQEE